jgi:hypothetical protein
MGDGLRPKRLRSEGSAPEDTGRSDTRTNTSTTPISSNLFQQISSRAVQQVQPAVSAVISLKQAAAKAERRLHDLLRHKEAGTFPKYIISAAPGLKLEFDCSCEEQQSVADAAIVQCRTQLLEQAISAAEKARSAAAAEYSTATLLAQEQLATAFDDLPPGWDTKPEVQEIRRDQQLQFEWEMHQAERKVDAKTTADAMQRQKKQASKAAAAVEEGPTDLEQQVQQMVDKRINQHMSKLQAAATGSSNSSKGKQQQQQQQQQRSLGSMWS